MDGNLGGGAFNILVGSLTKVWSLFGIELPGFTVAFRCLDFPVTPSLSLTSSKWEYRPPNQNRRRIPLQRWSDLVVFWPC